MVSVNRKGLKVGSKHYSPRRTALPVAAGLPVRAKGIPSIIPPLKHNHSVKMPTIRSTERGMPLAHLMVGSLTKGAVRPGIVPNTCLVQR
eukprot:813646-Amorphochlora_amoeboformis.AAC.1